MNLNLRIILILALILITFKFKFIKTQNTCFELNKCNNDSCSRNGRCYYESNEITQNEYKAKCICFPGWDTKINSITKCCYKQKHLIYTLLFEVIFGFGLGYFYIGKYNVGIIRLIIYCVCYLIICIPCFCNCFSESENVKLKNKITYISNIFIFIAITALLIIKIVDFFMIGFGLVNDVNEVKLNNW